MEILNRKASHDYFIKDTYECGIVLVGTEIKSIRKSNANINDAYARIKNGEVFLTNMYIGKYEEGNRFNHDERRERKLLLKKNEILKLEREINTKKLTLIPLKIYFVRNKAKIYTSRPEEFRKTLSIVDENDNILIIDDFLALGNALNGLIDIASQAKAKVAGFAIAIEKGFQGGGDKLREKGYRVESLAIVDSMCDDSLVFRKQ